MKIVLIILSLGGILARVDAAFSSDSLPPCSDSRLPRVEIHKSIVQTPRGPRRIEKSVVCGTEVGTYEGPRGGGMATLVTWTYSTFELDIGTSETRLFLITPDGEWREIPGSVDARFRPASIGRQQQLSPRDAAYSVLWGETLGGITPDAFFSRLGPISIKESGSGFCFAYDLRYPLTGWVRGCSSEPIRADAGYAKNVVSLAAARAIAVNTWSARTDLPTVTELNMRIMRIVDGDTESRFKYEFVPWLGSRSDNYIVEVDGLSGEATIKMRP